jgi:hypothetical protein
MKTVRRTSEPDMSPEAVAARLADLASLHELGMSLRAARVLGPGPVERAEEPAAEHGGADMDEAATTTRPDVA